MKNRDLLICERYMKVMFGSIYPYSLNVSFDQTNVLNALGIIYRKIQCTEELIMIFETKE